MANRIPLIVNPGASQIQELQTSDVLLIPNTVDVNGSVDISTTLTLSSTATASTRFVVSATTDSSSKTTGSATFAGGVGIEKKLFVGSDTDASDKDTGALVVEGGVGIEKKLFVGDDITAFATSDKKLKDNITPIPNALDKVISISGNTFKWNSESDYEGKEDTGVIAQEIEKLGLPGMITTRPNGTKAVRYERLVPLLIEAIKELDTKVKSLGG